MSANNSIELAALQTAAGTISSLFTNIALFKEYFKVAEMLTRCTILPESYRNNPANLILAMEIAMRNGMPVVSVAQNLHVVNGKPGWSGKYVLAVLNTCGRFEPIEFEWTGSEGDYEHGCRAWTYKKGTTERINGPWVTWKMVVDEGWLNYEGSPWKSMRELMFQYRAGSFFGNLRASDILLGLSTVEELQDVQHRSVSSLGTASRAEVEIGDISQLSAALNDVQLAAPTETPAAPPAQTSQTAATVPSTSSTGVAESSTTPAAAKPSAPSATTPSPKANSSRRKSGEANAQSSTVSVLSMALDEAPAATAADDKPTGSNSNPSSSNPSAQQPAATAHAAAVQGGDVTTAGDGKAVSAANPGGATEEPEWPDCTVRSEPSAPVNTASNTQKGTEKTAVRQPRSAPTDKQPVGQKVVATDLNGIKQLLILAKNPADVLAAFQQLPNLKAGERAAAETEGLEVALCFVADETTVEGMNTLKEVAKYFAGGGNLELYRVAYNSRVAALSGK